jgi:hypothetical protein
VGIHVGGAEVELLPERALWWAETRTLVVADLHWGKGETFRSWGIPVPAGELADDLGRLDRALEKTGAARLLVLGDLVHGALPAGVIAAVARWRERQRVPMVLVRGNHDRHVPVLPADWHIADVAGVLREGPFAFTHVPEAVPGAYTWAGHVHPMARLVGRADSLRLPCFHVGARVGILPAFGTFTGGVVLPRAPGDRVFVLAADRVIDV